MSYLDDLNTAPEPRDIWVVAELGADGQASPLALEIIGGARMMADGLGCYVHAVVMGAGLGEVAPQLIAAGADRVHVADDPALAYADAVCAGRDQLRGHLAQARAHHDGVNVTAQPVGHHAPAADDFERER